MKNPFQIPATTHFKNLIRTGLWFAVACNAGIVLVASVLFTYNFVSFGWRWMVRIWFSEEWGM